MPRPARSVAASSSRRFASALVTALVLSGAAYADDAPGSDEYGETPDCQEDQRDDVSTATGGAPVRACEGEHWEGSDAASSNRDCGFFVATTSTVATQDCGGGHSNNAMGWVNAGARLSQGGDGSAYASTSIGGVGQASAYQDGSGLAAVFFEDYSETLGLTCIHFQAQDCNALWETVHGTGLAPGSAVGEEADDCTVSSYDSGTCRRDNTAVTIDATPVTVPDLKTRTNADGTCTLYNDKDHDDVVDDTGETLQTFPCPDPKTRPNPDGSTTVYDDKDHDDKVDPGEARATTPVLDPRTRTNGDGTCTVYNDRDHDNTADGGEVLVVVPCPRPALRADPDGTVTVYDDENGNGQEDPGERVAATPPPPDGDGDNVPDAFEPRLCDVEKSTDPADGACDGDDYHPPTGG